MCTAGDPKGVIHTHSSVASCCESMREFLAFNKVPINNDDVYFSFLTLAHIFDRCGWMGGWMDLGGCLDGCLYG